MSNTAPPRAAPLALWRAASAFLGILFTLFGTPEDVAAATVLQSKPRLHLLEWLRAGEAMLRRLLLIEAAALPKPSSTSPRTSRTRVVRTRRTIEHNAEKPEEWRVSFRCFPADRRLPADRKNRSGHGASRRFHNAWPLAERYEALLRAFNNPAPIAKRLARKLFRASALIARLLFTPPNAPNLIGAETYAELCAACAPARVAFNSS